MNTDYWDQFLQTGSILDYLKYTACTLESSSENERILDSEGKTCGDSYTNRDSFSNNANW